MSNLGFWAHFFQETLMAFSGAKAPLGLTHVVVGLLVTQKVFLHICHS